MSLRKDRIQFHRSSIRLLILSIPARLCPEGRVVVVLSHSYGGRVVVWNICEELRLVP